MYIVVGLGNPDKEYERTRHNAGRMAADLVAKNPPAGEDGVKVVVPDTYMNKTGSVVAKIVKTKKAAEKLIVIYDDLDLPIGEMKISYNRGSGGHKGLESIIRAIKTKEFIRIRIGIGKKADTEKHILSKFSKGEMEKLKKVFKDVVAAVETIVDSGLERAMNEFNQ